MAIGNGQTGKQMPVGGNFTFGGSKGKPESQSSIKYGEDLRTGNSGKKGK